MGDIYKNTEEYNPNKKRKTLIVFYDMIADMLNMKKINAIVIELFIRGRKLNISLVFLTQSYFAVPKNAIKIAFNYSSDIDFQAITNLYKRCIEKPYSFLVIDTTLASDNPSNFRRNILERIYKFIITIDNKMKNCNIMLTEKQEKYQHYLLEKLINMNILLVKKHYLLIKDK